MRGFLEWRLQRGSHMAMRELTIDDCDWTIWDVHPTADARLRMGGESADALIQGWLVFQCGDEKRRLAPVPDGWEELDPEELESLLVHAERVHQRSPSMETNHQ